MEIEDKSKLFVFDKKEVILIFVFVIVITVTAFTLGVRVGKGLSLKAAGFTGEDIQKSIELKSIEEESADKDLNSSGTDFENSIDQSGKMDSLKNDPIDIDAKLEEEFSKAADGKLLDDDKKDNIPNYDTDDLLKIFKKNPSLLQHPIAINGKKAISINDRFDFFTFYKKDGNNFDKSTEAIKNGEHLDTTGEKSMDNKINS